MVREGLDKIAGLTGDTPRGYTLPMPSKIKPIPLRMPPELRERVDLRAKDTGKSMHAALLDLIERGFERITLPIDANPTAAPTLGARPARLAQVQANANAKEVLARAEAKAAHLAKGAPRKRKRPWNLNGVQLGPVSPPFGSRLKGVSPQKGAR